MSIIDTADNKITHLYDTISVPSFSAIIAPAPELTLPIDITDIAIKSSGYRNNEELVYNLHEATEILQTYFDVDNKKLEFSVHDDSGRIVVKIIDLDSGKILKELPSEAVLKMAVDIKRFQVDIFSHRGVLLDKII